MDAEVLKPLHVRVAEALGCKPQEYSQISGRHGWACHCPGANRGEAHGDFVAIDRYDTDWGATGPLIEKYAIGFETDYGHHIDFWIARRSNYPERGETEKRGPTPLIAVCNLLLALKEAGKL